MPSLSSSSSVALEPAKNSEITETSARNSITGTVKDEAADLPLPTVATDCTVLASEIGSLATERAFEGSSCSPHVARVGEGLHLLKEASYITDVATKDTFHSHSGSTDTLQPLQHATET